MRLFPKLNIWIVTLALCLSAFLVYRAIETKDCLEADFNRQWFRVGSCEF